MNALYPVVAERAVYRCEYCHAPETVFNFPFEVEHIIPPARGGFDVETNHALACRACNLFKTDSTEALDPQALVDALLVLVLTAFVGYEVVSKVPTMLHTPLMSGANAIHGVIVVGAIIVTATAESPLQLGLGLLGVILGTVNVVGGFVVTDRMLEMFRGRRDDRASGGKASGRKASGGKP